MLYNTREKTPAAIALLSLLLLLIGAGMYYKIRMLFADAPWIAFNVINDKSLSIQENRYGSFITQLVPLMGSLLHLPLKWILIGYSLSFNLFYLLSACLLYRMKQYIFCILLAFYCIVCTTESYYWTNNEVHQGICWLMLLFGTWQHYLLQKRKGLYPYLIFAVLGFLAIFSHPIVIIVALYVFGFYQLAIYQRITKQQIIYALIIILLVGIKYYLSARGWYDESRISALKSMHRKQLLHIFNTATAQSFFKGCMKQYWILTLMFCSAVFTMAYQKRYLPLLWMVGSAGIYFVGICTVYPDVGSGFYIESEWMSIVILIGLPFVFYVLPMLGKTGAVLTVTVFLLVGLFHIYSSSSLFRHHLTMLRKINASLRETHTTKLAIIRAENQPNRMEKIMALEWALPIETMILSQIENAGQGVVTAVSIDRKTYEEKYANADPNVFISAFGPAVIPTKLHPRYFPVDTVSHYVLIDQDTLIRQLRLTSYR